MSRGRRRWRVRPAGPVDGLAASAFPPLIRRLLTQRGVHNEQEAARFLFLDPWPAVDPLLLPGLEPAVQRLAQAATRAETVAVFGDFDVDGVTAAAVLTEALRELGATALPYIPDRFREGYGLNIPAVADLAARGASLLVAADCGTSSIAEVAEANRLGMDVLVLDHHAIPPELPASLALVNPKLGVEGGPYADLASVGVAYQTVAALYRALGRPWDAERFLDLVAIGTVGDLVPLLGENRNLVKQGLAVLRKTERPGLRALMATTAGLRPEALDVEAIAFGLAPRLNAAGRLAHAEASLRLLLTTDDAEAEQLAAQLHALNQDRQRQTQQALALAAGLLAAEDPDGSLPLVFIAHPEIPQGIAGLVASRLVDERYRPAIVCQSGEGLSRASCRSIPEFDIVGALRLQEKLLVRFGGHRMAAGFTVANEDVAALRQALTEYAGEALAAVELSPALDIDAEVPLSRLRGQEIRWLQSFAPHGQGNPEPTFLSRGALVAEARVIGNDGRHLRLKLKDGTVTWPAVAFDQGDAALTAPEGQRVDIVYSLAADRRGGGALELRVKDLAPTASGGPLTLDPALSLTP
jgi:single-stranded-DNA-specific exonuclease